MMKSSRFMLVPAFLIAGARLADEGREYQLRSELGGGLDCVKNG